MPRISLKLNEASVDNAIRQVRDYAEGLDKKTEQLRMRIAEELIGMIEQGFNGAPYDDIVHEGARVPNVQVSVTEEGGVSVVVANGKEAVFAEFGAGVYYNPSGSPHPNPPAGIVPIGTYGKGYGSRKIWGYYEDGELKLTHGTPASMPMYHAIQAILPRIPAIAKEVFAQP